MSYTRTHRSASSLLPGLIEFPVYELYDTFGFNVPLIPGTTYVMKSIIEARADGASLGRGFVDLRNTFEYELSGLPDNPFEDPTRGTTLVTGDVALPEPGTPALLMAPILAIGYRRTRSR